jgi:hypothetical protein
VVSGTSTKFYGQGAGLLNWILDGNRTDVLLNSTNSSDASKPAFISHALEDGDHQLMGQITSLQANGRIEIHYFEYVTSCSTNIVSRASVLITPWLPGLGLLLDMALILYGPVQMPQMSHKRRSLWIVLARRLFSMTSGGNGLTLNSMVLRTTEAVRPSRLD